MCGRRKNVKYFFLVISSSALSSSSSNATQQNIFIKFFFCIVCNRELFAASYVSIVIFRLLYILACIAIYRLQHFEVQVHFIFCIYESTQHDERMNIHSFSLSLSISQQRKTFLFFFFFFSLYLFSQFTTRNLSLR